MSCDLARSSREIGRTEIRWRRGLHPIRVRGDWGDKPGVNRALGEAVLLGRFWLYDVVVLVVVGKHESLCNGCVVNLHQLLAEVDGSHVLTVGHARCSRGCSSIFSREYTPSCWRLLLEQKIGSRGFSVTVLGLSGGRQVHLRRSVHLHQLVPLHQSVRHNRSDHLCR